MTRGIPVPNRIDLMRAGGTVPSCDKILLAFSMTLAQRHGWSTVRLCEFLAEPWGYQKEWEKWLKEVQEGEPEPAPEFVPTDGDYSPRTTSRKFNPRMVTEDFDGRSEDE